MQELANMQGNTCKFLHTRAAFNFVCRLFAEFDDTQDKVIKLKLLDFHDDA